jgi:ethanolamine utilization protein EutA (predicted chaperonin)
MTPFEKLAQAIVDSSRISSTQTESYFRKGVFTAAESVDANLSKVILTGDTAESRYVPKLASVTGLSSGDTVLCIKSPATGLIIIGVVVGDVTLA